MAQRARDEGEAGADLSARLVVAVAGGYVFASGLGVLMAGLLVAARVDRAQAVEIATLSGFVAYFAAGLAAFGPWRPQMIALVYFAGGLAMLTLGRLFA